MRLENNEGDLNQDIGAVAEESGKVLLGYRKSHKRRCSFSIGKVLHVRGRIRLFLCSGKVWIVQLGEAIGKIDLVAQQKLWCLSFGE